MHFGCYFHLPMDNNAKIFHFPIAKIHSVRETGNWNHRALFLFQTFISYIWKLLAYDIFCLHSNQSTSEYNNYFIVKKEKTQIRTPCFCENYWRKKKQKFMSVNNTGNMSISFHNLRADPSFTIIPKLIFSLCNVTKFHWSLFELYGNIFDITENGCYKLDMIFKLAP